MLKLSIEPIKSAYKPTRIKKKENCYSCYSSKEIHVQSGETKKIPLGFALSLEKMKASFKIGYQKDEKTFEKNWKKYIQSHFIEIKPFREFCVKKQNVSTISLENIRDHEIELVVCNDYLSDKDISIKAGDRVARLKLKSI